MNNIFNHVVAGNEVWRYATVFVVLLLAFIIKKINDVVVFKKVKKYTENKRAISCIFNSIPTPSSIIIFSIAFFASSYILKLNENTMHIIHTTSHLLVAVAVALFFYKAVDLMDFYLAKITAKTENKIDDMLAPMVRKTLRILIVIILGMYIMEQISGKSLTTLLAGLGIGGLAVALAAQDMLKNLFGTFMIIADHPFKVGDRILMNSLDGIIEEVGFRSTRIRTLTGHLVTVPNDKLVNTEITNISKRPYIRKLFNITITYDTTPDKVSRAVTLVQEILDKYTDNYPKDMPPRVYFNDFNDWSLNLMVIFWYAPPAYWDFMDFCQKINLEIMDVFNKEGIDFAFPSQTLYMANDDNRQLKIKQL